MASNLETNAKYHSKRGSTPLRVLTYGRQQEGVGAAVYQ